MLSVCDRASSSADLMSTGLPEGNATRSILVAPGAAGRRPAGRGLPLRGPPLRKPGETVVGDRLPCRGVGRVLAPLRADPGSASSTAPDSQGIFILNRPVAAIEARVHVRRAPRAPRRLTSPASSATSFAACGHNRCSKKSIVSSTVSSTQSGSGSISR